MMLNCMESNNIAYTIDFTLYYNGYKHHDPTSTNTQQSCKYRIN